MLSPGVFYKGLPLDLPKNVLFRKELVQAARGNRSLQAAVREACRQDILFYINAFIWQYNPRKIDHEERGPFITWPFQEGAFRTILDSIECHCDRERYPHQHDLLIEKSREMGASWICLIAMEWLWHFHPNKKFLCISRNEAAVEADDPDSLFWKIDFMHRYQPDWLFPGGSRDNLKRRGLYFGNEYNGSTITGQASTGKAGVGGRATCMFLDEFSQIAEDFEILQRSSDTTGCRIFNGTHKGMGTAFHELSLRPDLRKLKMHWTEHPDKNRGLYSWDKHKGKPLLLDKTYCFAADFAFVESEAPLGGPFPGIRSPWYDEACLRKGSPRAVAMDLDIDPGGSMAQFFNPLLIRILRHEHACPAFWEGDIAFDRDSGKPDRLIALSGGPLKLWMYPRPDGSIPPALYAGGTDLSTGTGATCSVFCLANAQTGEKVLEYASPHIPPEQFAPLVVSLCWLFADANGEPAKLAWETPGPGIHFGKCVLNLGFRNIYYRETFLGTGLAGRSDVPGWHASPETKRLLLDAYRAALDGRRFIEHSELALLECLDYSYTANGNVEHPHDSRTNDPTGARVNHGDRVIASALCWKMVESLGILGKKTKMVEEGPPEGSLAWRRKLRSERENQDAAWSA